MLFYISCVLSFLFFLYNFIKKKSLGLKLYKCKMLNLLYPKKPYKYSYIVSSIIGYAFILMSLILIMSDKDFNGILSSMFLISGLISVYRSNKIKTTVTIHNKGISYLFKYIKWEDISNLKVSNKEFYFETNNNMFRYSIQEKDRNNLEKLVFNKLNYKI